MLKYSQSESGEKRPQSSGCFLIVCWFIKAAGKDWAPSPNHVIYKKYRLQYLKSPKSHEHAHYADISWYLSEFFINCQTKNVTSHDSVEDFKKNSRNDSDLELL